MAVSLILFYVINPVFAAFCGVAAGADIRKLWALPVITAGLFMLGVFLFFEVREPLFMLYCACYLVIGVIAMLIRARIASKSGRNPVSSSASSR